MFERSAGRAFAAAPRIAERSSRAANVINGGQDMKKVLGRRSFLKRGAVAAGAATLGTGLVGANVRATAREDEQSGRLPRGDAAILLFLQVLETIEADLWRQYAELGGATNQPGFSRIDLPFVTGLATLYVAALEQLDSDMPQYIADNTDDEFSHAAFLAAYLASKGATTIDLNQQFANLEPSKVTGVPQTGRLTNLTMLTVDTSWWTRYRSDRMNPDFGDMFPPAVPTLNSGRHTAIPRTDSDLVADPGNPSGISNHTQAIANTAGFHFAFIEQGGSSLYPSLAQRVTSTEVLRILLSIGPTETAHFQTWHDKAGNAPSLSDTDQGFPGSTGDSVFFPDLTTGSDPEALQKNLIMPEPTIFLNRKFPIVSIVRPTETIGAAMGAVRALTADGLFIGQSDQFFELLRDLATDADAAKRGGD
jgi:hypothetical protein